MQLANQFQLFMIDIYISSVVNVHQLYETVPDSNNAAMEFLQPSTGWVTTAIF
jgi:hypothetical protein